MAKVLIIDDERSIRNTLKDILEVESYNVDVAENGFDALCALEKNEYQVIFSDIKMPQMDGIELLQKIKEKGIESSIIMISGHGNIETAVDCIKKGAYDFIEKPIDLNRLLVVVRNALNQNKQTSEIKYLKRKVDKKYEMIGNSPSVERLRKMITTVAPTDARVLITGENGTGKEILSQRKAD